MQDPNSARITSGQWLALAAALLGWMFDGLEMGLFPVVARPALLDLLADSSEGKISLWFSVATAGFLIGAATGGVLFGWLGDRIGRVRAMTLSVLVYALFSGVCGVATAAWQIAVLRFVAALGMGGEWALGVALVMEIWPDRSRALLAGLIGAVANFGYLLIALLSRQLGLVLSEASHWLSWIGLPDDWVAFLVANSPVVSLAVDCPWMLPSSKSCTCCTTPPRCSLDASSTCPRCKATRPADNTSWRSHPDRKSTSCPFGCCWCSVTKVLSYAAPVSADQRLTPCLGGVSEAHLIVPAPPCRELLQPPRA